MSNKDILDESYKMAEHITELRRKLHKNAEVGFDLAKTINIVKCELDELGIQYKNCGKCGLVAVIGNKPNGKTFMLRADMDALPISEQTGLSYACQSGAMHACGHDMHTAMLLGAAKILKEREQSLCGNVKLMFQPAEEIFEGSCDMIKDGLLTSPKVDGAMMLHVLASQPLPEGSVIISPEGVTAPAADYFTIKVKGKGCHGSMPSSGVDPIVVASHIIIALQEITSRELAINQRAIITIGCVKAGDAANVIPDVATISGSIRTYDELTRNFIKERISDISLGIASSFRANATVIYKGGCPSLYNDGKLSTAVAKYMNELIGDKAIEAKNLGTQSGGAGSEDFAYVSREVPSIMLALAAGQPKNGYLYPQHHPEVKFDESVLPIGTAAYAYTAMRWLEENN